MHRHSAGSILTDGLREGPAPFRTSLHAEGVDILTESLFLDKIDQLQALLVKLFKNLVGLV